MILNNNLRQFSYSLLSAFLVLGIGALIFYSLPYASINRDAGYTLPTALAIANGQRLYADIQPSHLSLTLYLFALFYRVNNFLSYEFFLAICILFEIGIAAILFQTIRKLQGSMSICLLGSLISLGATLTSDGIYVVFEPFSVFFSIASFYVILSNTPSLRPIFFATSLSAVAFLFKQYSGTSFLLVCFWILLGDRKFRSKLTNMLMATTIFILLVCTYYGAIAWVGEASLDQLSIDLFGLWYKRSYMEAYEFVSHIFYSTPELIGAPFLGWVVRKNNRPLMLTSMAVLLNCLPMFVRQYPHYYILFAPYGVLIGIIVLLQIPIRRPILSFFAYTFVIAAGINVGILLLGDAWRIREWKPRQNQVHAASQLSKVLTPGEPTLNVASPAWNYLCNLTPASREVSFNFFDILSPEVLARALSGVSQVLVDRDSQDYSLFPLSNSMLSTDFYLVSSSTLEIWKRKTVQETELSSP